MPSLSTPATQADGAPVQIQSVDPVSQTATGLTRQGAIYTIDTRYHVGAVHVTPAPNEQWYVKRLGRNWVLDRKLPQNTEVLLNVADNPQMGMVQIGSSGVAAGPMMLLGSLISAGAPFQLDSFPTVGLPDASNLPGTLIWDSTAEAVKFSDGSTWNLITSVSGGGSSFATVISEVPTGAKNGTNTTFTVGHNFRAGTTAVYRNGLRERLNFGYTETTPNVLVFTTAPLVDDDITVDYVVQ